MLIRWLSGGLQGTHPVVPVRTPIDREGSRLGSRAIVGDLVVDSAARMDCGAPRVGVVRERVRLADCHPGDSPQRIRDRKGILKSRCGDAVTERCSIAVPILYP